MAGKSRRGSHCTRRKRVYSPVLGRNVMRCASFSGGGGLGIIDGLGLGKFPINFNQVKDTLITGGVAVGGAVASRRGVSWIIGAIESDENPWEPGTKVWIKRGLEVAGGLFLGVIVAKYWKPDIGAAIAVGPIVLNGVDLLAEVLKMPELANGEGLEGYYDPALAGYDQEQAALGMMVNQEDWVPQAMFQPDLSAMGGLGLSEPAWSM